MTHRPRALFGALLLLVAVCLTGAACIHHPPHAGIPEPPPAPDAADVSAAMRAGAAIARLGSAAAAYEGDFWGCALASGTASALRSSAQAVAEGGDALPEVYVDLVRCYSLLESPPPPLLEDDLALLIESGVLSAADLSLTLVELSGPTCTAAAYLHAGREHLELVARAVVAETLDPDGLLEVPSVRVDRTACADAVPTQITAEVPPRRLRAPPGE